jgi:hypothetical protein
MLLPERSIAMQHGGKRGGSERHASARPYSAVGLMGTPSPRRPLTAPAYNPIVIHRQRIVPSRVMLPEVLPSLVGGATPQFKVRPTTAAVHGLRPGRWEKYEFKSRPRGGSLKRLEVGAAKPFKSWTSPDVVFKQIDKDNSGLIDILELKRFFRGTLDAGKLDQMFADLDEDGSGEIDIEEWRRGYHNAGFGEKTIVGQSSAGLSVLLSLVPRPHTCNFLDLNHNRPPQKIHKVEERGLTLLQLRDLWNHIRNRCEPEGWMGVDGALLRAETATLYEVLRYVIKPCSQSTKCSYVEYLGNGPQLPLWCVSHYTGMPFKDMLECLEQHARDRGISEYAPYWICEFAVNQHALVANAALDDPFRKALDVATGTITVMDRRGLALKRVWCLHEAHETIRRLTHKWDLYTPYEHICVTANRIDGTRHRPCTAVGFIDGYCVADLRAFEYNKMRRESHFPLPLVTAALKLSVQEAHASVEAERRVILNTFASNPHHAPYPKEHEGYEVVNCLIRARVAMYAIRAAADTGGAGSLFKQCLGESRASTLQRAVLNFSNCKAFDEQMATEVCEALPPTMEYLTLCFYDRPESRSADAFLKELRDRLFDPEETSLGRMRELVLKSNAISREGAYALGVALSQKTMPSLQVLDFGMPAQLSHECATQITTCAYQGSAPKALSFFGNRCASTLILRRQGLTSADLILLIASAVTGACGQLSTLDVSENKIDNKGLEHLERALKLVSGVRKLPDLNVIDLSHNEDTTQGMRQKVLEARRGPKPGSAEAGPSNPPSPVGGVRAPKPMKFELNTAYQFRIEPYVDPYDRSDTPIQW